MKHFLFVAFLLIATISFSQKPNDKIPPYSSVNESYLEYLIKIKIDSVRAIYHLNPLFKDSILSVASKYHANYLLKNKILSHEEKNNPCCTTPQDRANHFGAQNYSVGENVAYTFYDLPLKSKSGKTYVNKTYNDVAYHLVESWVLSRGHFLNIINTSYLITGVSVAIDIKNSQVYAVQKFAFVPNISKLKTIQDSSFSRINNIYTQEVLTTKKRHKENHVYGIKAPEDLSEECYICQFSLYRGALKLKYNQATDSYILSSDDPALVNKLIKRRRDGFAVEAMEYIPYDCGNPEYFNMPSRRDHSCMLSGKITKPLYRKKLKHGFGSTSFWKGYKSIAKQIEDKKIESFQYNLGKSPKGLRGLIELNLVLIKEKKICTILKPHEACGELFKFAYDLKIRNSIPEYPYVPGPEIKSITFEIPFEKGKSVYKKVDIQPILDSLISDNFIVDSLAISAYSSIEGNDEVNQKLQLERATTIASALLSEQRKKISYTIKTKTNWELFEIQKKKFSALSPFKSLDTIKVKEIISQPQEALKYEKYLSEQRKAIVRMKIKIEVDSSNIDKHLIRKYKGFVKLYNKNPENKSSLDSLYKLQYKAYEEIKSGHLNSNFLSRIYSSDIKDYKFQLNYINYLVGIKYYSTSLESGQGGRLYDALSDLNKSPEADFNLYFNQLIYLVYNRTNSKSDKEINKLIGLCKERVANEDEKEVLTKVEVNYYILRLNKNLSRKERTDLESGVSFLTDYFMNEKIANDTLRYNIARLLLYHDFYFESGKLLKVTYDSNRNHVPSLLLLSKVIYETSEIKELTGYQKLLIEVSKRVPKEDWCALFIGYCNISFQVFDGELFRDFYCETCNK